MMPSHNQESSHSNEQPLQGWKEIAAYLERDVRTAQRWELDEALPIRRHRTDRRSSVYAYPSELQSWRSSRQANPADGEASVPAGEQPGRPLLPTLAVAAAIAAALLAIWFGPVLSPPSPITEAAQNAFRTELVWAEARGISPQGSVSPDGKFVTYVDWIDEGNLAIRDLETEENRLLTHTAGGNTGDDDHFAYALESRISPKGDQVVYSWARPSPAGETGELRLLTIDDAATQRRTIWSPADGSYVTPQDWFPAGDRIAAVVSHTPKDHQIVSISVADGEIRQIRSIPWSASPQARVSPDGRFIAYSRSVSREQPAKDIFVVAVDGSSETAVVKHTANDELVGWSRNGDYLLINSDRSGQPGIWVQPLKNAEPAGELQLIVPNVDVGAGVGIAQDGSLYYSVRVSDSRMKLAEIDLKTGEFVVEPENAVEKFVGHNSRGVFSPNGTEFAYISRREGGTRRVIVVRSLATGEERELEHDLRGVFWLIWPAGGGGLILQGQDERGRYGFFSLSNGHAEFIGKGAFGVLSPDRERLLYRSFGDDNRQQSIHSYRASDGSVEEIPGDFGTGWFSMLPDGRIATIHEGTEVRLYPMGGGDAVVLWSTDEQHRFASPIIWSSREKTLLVSRQEPDAGEGSWRLWAVPVDSSAPYPTELIREGRFLPDIHPDGKQVLYTEGSSFAQFWAMRGLPFEARDSE